MTWLTYKSYVYPIAPRLACVDSLKNVTTRGAAVRDVPEKLRVSEGRRAKVM